MKRREGTTSVVRIAPQRGEGRLAGGERSEPPDRRGITICTPAGVAGAPRAPAGARWSRRHGFQGFAKGAHPWLRARAEINSHFGASAGRADARRRDEGDVGHRRGAATKQMPARRRAPSGCGPQPAWGPAAKCEFISARALSKERANQLAIVGDLDGTAVCVELLVGIDAQDLVDGECQVLNRHRIILGVRGRGRCASYHYTSADFNTREGNREGPRPVISSRIVVEAWGTSEFGQNEH